MVSSSDLGDRPQWSPEFPILLTIPSFPRGTGPNGLLVRSGRPAPMVTSPRAFIFESALLPPWAPLLRLARGWT